VSRSRIRPSRCATLGLGLMVGVSLIRRWHPKLNRCAS
jgi:hypothetical protein